MGRAAPHSARTSRVSQTRQQHKCACRRSAHPSSGSGAKDKDRTRAQQRAAGTKNTALFDIVNWDDGQRLVREPRARTALVSRASAARPGTRATRRIRVIRLAAQVSRMRIRALGRPGLVPLAHARSLRSPGTREHVSAAPSARAGATHPRCDRAPRSRRSAAPRRIRVASLPRSFAACPRGRRRSSDWPGCRARRAWTGGALCRPAS